MAMQNAQILFPVNVPNAFDYSVPCDFEIRSETLFMHQSGSKSN